MHCLSFCFQINFPFYWFWFYNTIKFGWVLILPDSRSTENFRRCTVFSGVLCYSRMTRRLQPLNWPIYTPSLHHVLFCNRNPVAFRFHLLLLLRKMMSDILCCAFPVLDSG